MQTYKIKNEIFVGFIPKIITQLPKDFDWGSEDLFQRKLVNRTLGQGLRHLQSLFVLFVFFLWFLFWYLKCCDSLPYSLMPEYSFVSMNLANWQHCLQNSIIFFLDHWKKIGSKSTMHSYSNWCSFSWMICLVD